MRHVVAVAAVLLALVPALVVAGDSKPGKDGKKKPHLEVRVSPRFAFSPVRVLVTAELVGGDDVDDFNCPDLEWDWDDGSKSSHESDCDPLDAGNRIERRYTAEHDFHKAGNYNVKVTMRHVDRVLAIATVRVTVRAGAGDPTMDGGSDGDS
jgi:hypothetical protein